MPQTTVDAPDYAISFIGNATPTFTTIGFVLRVYRSRSHLFETHAFECLERCGLRISLTLPTLPSHLSSNGPQTGTAVSCVIVGAAMGADNTHVHAVLPHCSHSALSSQPQPGAEHLAQQRVTRPPLLSHTRLFKTAGILRTFQYNPGCGLQALADAPWKEQTPVKHA